MGRVFLFVLAIVLAGSSGWGNSSSQCSQIFGIGPGRVTVTRQSSLGLHPSSRGLPAKTRLATYNLGLLHTDLQMDAYGQWMSPLVSRRMELLGRTLSAMNSDILVITEAGSARVLRYLNSHHLNNQYFVLAEPLSSADTRLDVAFLIRKTLPVHAEWKGYDGITWDDPAQMSTVSLFRQGLAGLTLSDAETQEKLMIILGIHMKSQRGRHGDPESRILRSAQAQGLLELYAQISIHDHNRGVPVVLAGDFNFDLSGSMDSDWEQQLADVFDLANGSVPQDDRMTHVFFNEKKQQILQQLDGIFMGRSSLLAVLRAETVRPRDNIGKLLPFPRNKGERNNQASDHYPVLTELDTQRLAR
jgi:hypothetical protein